jgi:hypothetical protein
MAPISASLPASAQVGLPLGAIVGEKYRIDGFLGEGGMGVVLSATHLALGSPVAIKIVRDDLAANEAIVSRLIFEARAAASMRSAHVVRVLDVARLPTGAPYIVMEQLQGWDLATALAKRGVFALGEAIGCVLQACDGLAEAHQMGIVHRDLKPENLFLATTPEGVVLKILDFGISKDTTSRSGPRATLTKGGSAVGSPLYMAPEQMRASPDLDARADIWSLGTILFELLSGRCPFEADSPASLCSKVMVEEAPSLLGLRDEVPEQLDAIVRKCLQKEPRERFQSVTELAQALRAFVDEQQRSHAEREHAEHLREQQAQVERARAARPFVNRKVALVALALAALCASTTAAVWHEPTRARLLGWLGPRHAAAAELARPVAPRAMRAPAVEPQASAPAPAESTTAPREAVSPTPPASPKPIGRAARATFAPPMFALPKNVEPAARKADADPALGKVEARYGL